MLICRDCGETETFRATRVDSYTIYINKYDEEDKDKEDEFLDDHREDTRFCDECGSENVEDLDDKEYVLFRWTHTDKQGKWSTEELDEEERDEKIILEAGVDAL